MFHDIPASWDASWISWFRWFPTRFATMEMMMSLHLQYISVPNIPFDFWILYCIYIYGCFQKKWYPQIIHFNRVVHYKKSILGFSPYFWKRPYNRFVAQVWGFHQAPPDFTRFIPDGAQGYEKRIEKRTVSTGGDIKAHDFFCRTKKVIKS